MGHFDNGLSPARDPADLVAALYAARRDDRRDARADVEALLTHDEPIVREEAVSLLLTKWRFADLREFARYLLQHDPDDGVRARAAIGLAAISEGDDRGTNARLLSETYQDRATSGTLRVACFEAVWIIAGRPPQLFELDDTGPGELARLLAEISAT